MDLLVDIIKETIKREGYRAMKVLSIYSQIDKSVVRSKYDAGMIRPCGKAVPELKVQDIDDATKIVAQMGMEPWLEAMNEYPDFDVIVGGRTYDPTPYAAFCAWKGLKNMGTVYHMGKIMECGALCATPKSKSALAIINDDDFVVSPLDTFSLHRDIRCGSLPLRENQTRHSSWTWRRPALRKCKISTIAGRKECQSVRS